MSSDISFRKLAMIAGGAAAVGLVVFYLSKQKRAAGGAGKPLAEYNKDDTLAILSEIVKSQNGISTLVEGIAKDLVSKPETKLIEALEVVQKRMAPDPLESRGLTIQQFDELLEKFQEEDDVKGVIANILNAGPVASTASKTGSAVVDISKLVEVHESMLGKVTAYRAEFLKWSDAQRKSADAKLLTIAAQSMIASHVLREHKLTPSDVEEAVIKQHQALASHEKFDKINRELQSIMSTFMSPA